MIRIVIEADAGQVTVSVEREGADPEQLSFATVEEALEAVEDRLETSTQAPDTAMPMSEMEAADMWEEEASAREKRNQMTPY